jgi:hypothetical protein
MLLAPQVIRGLMEITDLIELLDIQVSRVLLALTEARAQQVIQVIQVRVTSLDTRGTQDLLVCLELRDIQVIRGMVQRVIQDTLEISGLHDQLVSLVLPDLTEALDLLDIPAILARVTSLDTRGTLDQMV